MLVNDYISYVYGDDWEYDENYNVVSHQYTKEEIEQRSEEYIAKYGRGR